MISGMSPTSQKQYVFIGDDTRVHVVFFFSFELLYFILGENFFFFELQNEAFIPFIRRNLISVLILDRLGYNFLFGTGKVNLHQDSLLFGN